MSKGFKSLIFAVIGTVLLTIVCQHGSFQNKAVAGQTKLIRVGLEDATEGVDFKILGEYELIDLFTGQAITDLFSDEEWEAKPNASDVIHIKSSDSIRVVNADEVVYGLGSDQNPIQLGSNYVVEDNKHVANTLNGISLICDGKEIGTFVGPIAVKEITHNNVNNVSLDSTKSYRGDLELRLSNTKKIQVINQLPLEEYLWGVVPYEMPSSWSMDALKAQAVVARNYALRVQHSGKYDKLNYDVTDDTRTQVYNGLNGEKANTTKAVNETAGIVAVYNGQLIDSVYHASSGGFTESSQDVWTFPTSYLQGKPDLLDTNSRHYEWEVELSHQDLVTKLKTRGFDIAKVKDVQIQEMTGSGNRVKNLKIVAKNSNDQDVVYNLYNADVVRNSLGLKSALFTFDKDRDSQGNLVKITFNGSGWGHGIGMSQYGAQGLALGGSSYNDILKYYYTGISLVENYNE